MTGRLVERCKLFTMDRVWSLLRLTLFALSGCSLLFFTSGCHREPVETVKFNSSGTGSSQQQEDVLERIPISIKSNSDSESASRVLRILARSGLIHQDSSSKKNSKNKTSASEGLNGQSHLTAAALHRFSEIYDIEVQVETITVNDLEDGTIPPERLDGFDLLFVPTHWLSSRDLRKKLVKLSDRKISGMAKTREAFLSSFSPLPPDLNIHFVLPYFRTTYGIYYNLVTNTNPPESWEDCFLFSDQKENWDAVSYLNDPEVTLSIGGLLSSKMDKSKRELFMAVVDPLVSEIKALATTTNATPNLLKSIRNQHLEDSRVLVK